MIRCLIFDCWRRLVRGKENAAQFRIVQAPTERAEVVQGLMRQLRSGGGWQEMVGQQEGVAPCF